MRKRDKKLAKSYRGAPCLICGSTETTVGDHIFTFGSRPDLDTKKGTWPLCYIHHQEKERSLKDFVFKYKLEDEMLERGFFVCPLTRKWRAPEVRV